MYIVNNYTLAVIFCVVTMLCWGSWGNMQKLCKLQSVRTLRSVPTQSRSTVSDEGAWISLLPIFQQT